MKRYEGKSILLTGGGGGIGGAVARRLAEEGGAIGVLDRRGEAAAKTVAALEATGARAVALEADITDPAAVENAVTAMRDALGGLDVLVNNAAFALRGDIETTELADWKAEVEIDLNGQFVCAKAVLPGMVAQGRGAIVNIGSVNGLMALGNPAYSASKAGLLSFTQSLAVEYGPKGIRANMVSPGTVETDIETWRIRRAKNPKIFDVLARWYPVGRVGQPEDIAAAVAFIAADEAAFVNGANLVVDGGLTAGLPVMIKEFVLE
jgi:NAD(P)-dependent dehydrogenase (short-subunit alcohol dehydrogenase family)